jgi:hypothetical protein
LQLERVFQPVINDQNKNLLHYFCNNNLPALQKVFMQDCSKCLNKTNKQFPLFKDFNDNSPLDQAFERKDDQIFNFLLKKLIEIQDGFESTHLVEGWIANAINEKKDINCIFDSKLFTKRL